MSRQVSPLLKVAHVPPPSVPSTATVRDAVAVMVGRGVGAVAIVDGERLAGIFTERDLMTKVVHAGKDPARTQVVDVMVRDPVTLRPDGRRSVALTTMIQGHFRHIPITDADGRLLGMLALRQLLHEQLARVTRSLDALEAYVTADGAGG